MSDEGFLQRRIDAQADRIEALEAALRQAYLLNGYMAETYTLSLPDFRYLNNVSTDIRAALAPPEQTK